MAEYEELRLTVTLIDNASQGLATLRQNLSALGGNENREALTRMQREVAGLGERLGQARVQMGRTSETAQLLGRTIKGAATTFATAFISHFAIDSLRRFTDEMVRLDGTAKQFGVGGATIKNIVDQMKLMGIEGGAAQNLVTNFATSLAEISRQGSRIRQELMKGAVSDPGSMAAFISRITGFASRGEMENALNEVVEAANNAFQHELARTGGNEIMAAENRNRFLKALGLDDATMALIQGRFKATTEEQRAEYARRSSIAQAFSKEWNEMDQKSEKFISGLQIGLLPLIQAINGELDQMGEKWGKILGESLTRDLGKIIESVKFAYDLWNDPAGAIKGAFKDQASKAHPTLQRLLGVETTEENRKYWEDQAKRGVAGKFMTPEEQAEAEARAGISGDYGPDQPRPPRPEMPALPPGVGSQNPMLQRMSYSPGQPIIVPGGDAGYSSGGAQSQFTRAIRTGTFDALVDFKNFMQTGGGVGTGGTPGVTKASLTTGGQSTGGYSSGSTSTSTSTSPSSPPSGGSPGANPSANPTTGAPSPGGPAGGPNYPGSKFNLAAPAGEPTQGAVGVSPEQYDVFRRSLANIESGGRYGLKGGSSNRFSGAYQFGSAEIAETAKSLGERVPSREQFLSDPAMQERYMGKYTANHHDQLMKRSPEYRAMTPEQRLSVLGYAHNQGVGGAAKWLRTGKVGADAFGTRGTKYSEAIQRNLARTRATQAVASNEDEARTSLDADLGKEVSSRVTASGNVNVEVSNGEQTKGESRKKLFTKNLPRPPKQMDPAASTSGDENGMNI